MDLNLNLYPLSIPNKETPLDKVVSLSNLACYLHPFVINGEFIPLSPWQGFSIQQYPPLKRPGPTIGTLLNIEKQFNKIFNNSVKNLIDDKPHVGLSFSGGMDSTAILYHILKLKESSQKITLFHIEMIDDQGVSSKEQVDRVLSFFDINPEIVYIDFVGANKKFSAKDYPWSEKGPSLAGFPYLLKHINSLAHEVQADILLHGDGANELIEAPRFLFKSLLKRNKLEAIRYLVDVLEQFGLRQLKGEMIHLFTSKNRVYNKMLLKENKNNSIISSEFQDHVEEWFQQFVLETEQALNIFPLWEDKEIFKNVFPHSSIEDNGSIIEKSPFMEKEFVEFIFQISPEARFNYLETSYYLRNKSLLSKSLPKEIKFLFQDKQIFSQAFQEYFLALKESEKNLSQCRQFNLINEEELSAVL